MKINFQGRVALLRGLVFGRRSSAALPLLAAMVLFSAVGATAETTNTLSDAEIQGRQLVQKILELQPTENSTNSGVLDIRDTSGEHDKYSIKLETIVTATNWLDVYEKTDLANTSNSAGPFRLVIAHDASNSNQYRLTFNFGDNPERHWTKDNSEAVKLLPFAGDFGCADLGLEFFHWPQQKVLKKEFHRQCACTVLESTNPHPAAGGYSRVVSWIDNDSLGIVEAYAYDANGKKLKNFYPKDFKKVDGQYQLQSMVMENLQTGSKTRLEFDLKK